MRERIEIGGEKEKQTKKLEEILDTLQKKVKEKIYPDQASTHDGWPPFNWEKFIDKDTLLGFLVIQERSVYSNGGQRLEIYAVKPNSTLQKLDDIGISFPDTPWEEQDYRQSATIEKLRVDKDRVIISIDLVQATVGKNPQRQEDKTGGAALIKKDGYKTFEEWEKELEEQQNKK
ncbi:MAG: hypothetical protein PHC97_00725 [Patescibacteria group bacterium]|nr:hypothetical protein [Patescibacteria group bacterium]